ncbi:tRNA guanosine(34) transglycosylase Tgt [Myxococcota bacterium]|nr:tRNA guanosine(34) transglycosylase Tgt [Myxococcota bacterium]MBU1533858.1 tRNA guanosine(34) transglycosylase Tgt [Myxococcota bacterium]
MTPLTFSIEHTHEKARAGTVTTAHGTIPTPIFMPVGTYGSVKSIDSNDLKTLGARIILSNTFHLHERPGEEQIEALGGLHKFMAWDGPILTDSGGFQVFSLARLAKISEEGVHFQSPVNGSKRFFNPEVVMGIQRALGIDIAMAFDQCPPGDSDRQTVLAAMERTTRWAARCRQVSMKPHQARFGIFQGGIYEDLRRRHLEEIVALDFDGYAIGGLSVGEPIVDMYRILEAVAHRMPEDKPRYLMGVGTPLDIITAISHGVDMFDCVMPTRNARNGQLFTDDGVVVLTNARHKSSRQPIMEGCSCMSCTGGYTRAYLHHLIKTRELLYYRLATIHNLHYYLSLVTRAREAIVQGEFGAFANTYISRYKAGDRATN